MGLREEYFGIVFVFLTFGFFQCAIGLSIGAIGALLSSIIMFGVTFTKSFREFDR